MEIGTVHPLPGLTPKTDERFSHLLSQALDGRIPVYFAAIPLALCVPFDLVRSTQSASGRCWGSQPKRATPDHGALNVRKAGVPVGAKVEMCVEYQFTPQKAFSFLA